LGLRLERQQSDVPDDCDQNNLEVLAFSTEAVVKHLYPDLGHISDDCSGAFCLGLIYTQSSKYVLMTKTLPRLGRRGWPIQGKYNPDQIFGEGTNRKRDRAAGEAGKHKNTSVT